MEFTFGLIQQTWDGSLYISRGQRFNNFQNKIVFLSLMIIFVSANSEDPDEMPHDNLGLHCLSMYL